MADPARNDPLRRLLARFDRETVHATTLVDDASERTGAAPEPLFDVGPQLVDKGEIGRGGMGSVHVVYDTQLLRHVARKSLHAELASSPERLAGFVEEAQIHAQLDHPHIVPVHALGVDDSGVPYFTMKLVHGVSFFDFLRDPARAVGTPERLHDGLEVFLRVCDAIAFAHARGVVHRDLKPENVMVGEFGAVYVMDWGLARALRDDVQVSSRREGASFAEHRGPLGTPAYMSPEAARGARDECDERTDVFGLGAILYHLVTGHTPYGPRDVIGTLEAARAGAIRPPEEALGDVGVSKKLLRIVTKALDRDAQRRHATAVELKRDVQSFLRGGLHLPRAGFPAGTRIVVEGDVGDAAYIIVRGECEAWKLVPTPDGPERRTLRRMGPGDVFGETAVLSDMPRSATVEAIDDVTALVVTRAALEEGLGLDSWLGTLVRALALRFRELDERVNAR